MTYTRRNFLQNAGVTIGAATCVPSLLLPRLAKANNSSILIPSAGRWADPDLRALADQAVDAARTAGANYADIRFTLTRTEGFAPSLEPSEDNEWHSVGVRVLVDGYWGFMGSSVWTSAEMTRLAKGAVAQAKANSIGGPRDADLGPPPPAVSNGDWRMPVKYDPFDIPKGEKMDILRDLFASFKNYDPRVTAGGPSKFQRQAKLFASSDGSRWMQTVYLSALDLGLTYAGQMSLQVDTAMMPLFTLSAAGKGWEHIIESDIIDRIPEYTAAVAERRFIKPVEINRYDAVMSPQAVAALMDPTIGAATELDRALGYEANAEGTSYLNEPLEMVGTYKLGTPLVTVMANRSQPGGLATVKWDDESVEPEAFALVKDGILSDFQTTRESATWLASYYQRKQQPVRSHGCASAQSAGFITMQHAPNLQLMPGKESTTFEDMVRDTKKGVAIMNISVNMDHQQLNGAATGAIREINNGKLGKYLSGAGFQFRAPELWRNVIAIGGSQTQEWFGFSRRRGQPVQSSIHSVGAVPAKIANIGIIDFYRKA